MQTQIYRNVRYWYGITYIYENGKGRHLQVQNLLKKGSSDPHSTYIIMRIRMHALVKLHLDPEPDP